MSPKDVNAGLFKFANKSVLSPSHQINEEQIFKEHHFVEVKEYLVGAKEKRPIPCIGITSSLRGEGEILPSIS